MTPAPSTAPRIALLGCGLVAVATLALSGCGGGSAATAESSSTTPAKATAPTRDRPRAATAGCPNPVHAFIESLDALRRQLAVGLSYEQYAGEVKALRGSYDDLPIARLTLECVSATGSPAEAALNEYIDAANAWGECLADASCTTATIEPLLQRKWRAASHLLSAAQ